MNKYKVLTLSLSLLISSAACASQKTIKLSVNAMKEYDEEIHYTSKELQSVDDLKKKIQDVVGVLPAAQRLTWVQHESQLGGLSGRTIRTPINSNENLKDFLRDNEVKEQALVLVLRSQSEDNRQINIKESRCTIQ